MQFAGEIAEAVVNACAEEGLLLNRVRPNAIRLMPALIVGEEEVEEAVDILERVLAKKGRDLVEAGQS